MIDTQDASQGRDRLLALERKEQCLAGSYLLVQEPGDVLGERTGHDEKSGHFAGRNRLIRRMDPNLNRLVSSFLERAPQEEESAAGICFLVASVINHAQAGLRRRNDEDRVVK